MKSLKKDLMFWAIIYEKMMVAMSMGIMVYFAMMAMTNSDFTLGDWSSMIGFLGVFLCVMVLSNGYTGVLSYFPQSISMGTTRKSSFVSMQIMQHVMAFQILVIGAILYYLIDRAKFEVLMEVGVSVLGGILLLIALSNFICSTFGKFSRTVGTTLYMIAVLVAVVIMVLILFPTLTDRESILGNFRDVLAKPYLFLGGILADAVAIGVYYRIIRKQDLQF